MGYPLGKKLMKARFPIAIRFTFAYSEGSSSESGVGGMLPKWQSGFTQKGLHLCGLWAFVSLPATAALKGSKMRCVKLRVLEKSPSCRWP